MLCTSCTLSWIGSPSAQPLQPQVISQLDYSICSTLAILEEYPEASTDTEWSCISSFGGLYGGSHYTIVLRAVLAASFLPGQVQCVCYHLYSPSWHGSRLSKEPPHCKSISLSQAGRRSMLRFQSVKEFQLAEEEPFLPGHPLSGTSCSPNMKSIYPFRPSEKVGSANWLGALMKKWCPGVG